MYIRHIYFISYTHNLKFVAEHMLHTLYTHTHTHTHTCVYIYIYIGGSFRGVVANVLDSDIVVSKFEFQSVHFPTNAPWQRYEPLYPPIYGLNSTTIIIL